MKTISKLLLAITFCFPLRVSAVRAYPYPVEVKQPNGETILVQAHGDEFFHYSTTTDGFVVTVDNEGYLTFAEISDKGYIQPGKVRVSGNILKSNNNSFLKANSPEFIQQVKKPAMTRTGLMKKEIQHLHANSINKLRSSKSATVENTKELVILAEFADNTFSVSNPQQAFTAMLNQPDYRPNGAAGFTGSVRDYLISCSEGAYQPEFVVYGPVRLPNNMAFYGENNTAGIDKNAAQMALDACKVANDMYPDLNFAEFPSYYITDAKGKQNGPFLYNVSVIYAGYNEAENNGILLNTIWPHYHYLQSNNIPESQRIIDGVIINPYTCSSELKGKPNDVNMAGIGTFTHEYSHALGLPDLYDANGSTDGTLTSGDPRDWDIMSNGNYRNEGNTPPSYSSMERWILGWTALYAVSGTRNITIPPITSSDISSEQRKNIIIAKSPTETSEFFTLEVRKNEGWDSALRGEGMLIYHVDIDSTYLYDTEYGKLSMLDLLWSGIPNIIGNHPGIKLITANGEIMPYGNYSGHLFPGENNVTSISSNTNPGFIFWNNEKSKISISNIVRNDDGSVSFMYSDTETGIKENNTNLPFAFSSDNVIYFNNISGSTQVNIYDINGKLCLSKNILEPDNQEITVPGLYIVKLQTNNEVFTYKVIIR